MDDRNTHVFRVEPLFVHRTLAAQAFGTDETAPLFEIANAVTKAIVANKIADVRIAALTDGLQELEGMVVTIRAGFFFRRDGSGAAERVVMHNRIKVGEDQFVEVVGELNAARLEVNSAHGHLSGRANVLVVGIVQRVDMGKPGLALRPLLIGFPYYAPEFRDDALAAPGRPEVSYFYVEEFGLQEKDMHRAPTKAELSQVFAMPEQAIKEAFGHILGLSSVPKGHGGQRSDLVAEVTVRGSRQRAAFAFNGPGGRPEPWTLYPDNISLRGDKGARLFFEPADIQVVQHCCRIAGPVRHMMDALATLHGRRHMIIDGDGTARILKATGLLP